jgi:hypothetical protein
MANYKILYWQEIPSQIFAEDDETEISLPLAAKFLECIEDAAMSRGLAGTDDYLAQWKWGDVQQRDGSAPEVAEAVRQELESKSDWQ